MHAQKSTIVLSYNQPLEHRHIIEQKHRHRQSGGSTVICLLWSQIDKEKKTHGCIMLEFEIFIELLCNSNAGPLSCRNYASSSIKHAHKRKCSEDKLPAFRNKRARCSNNFKSDSIKVKLGFRAFGSIEEIMSILVPQDNIWSPRLWGWLYCFAKARSEPERNEDLNIVRQLVSVLSDSSLLTIL